MKIRIRKYLGEYEVQVIIVGTVVYHWNLAMETDGDYESEEFSPHE